MQFAKPILLKQKKVRAHLRMCVFFCNFAPEMKTVTVLLIAGWFSVSAEKQVCFSPGNLQYKAEGTHQTADGEEKTGVWQFATNAWEEAQSPWLDKFAWATSGWDNTANDPHAIRFEPTENNTTILVLNEDNCTGYGPSQGGERSQDLTGNSAKHDWGVYNAISNGGDKAGEWRTLLYSEWEYLFYSREKADELYAFAYLKTPDSIAGIVLLPDGWTGGTLKEGYTLAEWETMQEKGAVFLPEGKYWTASGDNSNNNKFAIALYFEEGTNNDPQDTQEERYSQLPVRLVQDYVNPATGLEEMRLGTRGHKTLRNGQLLVEHGEKLFNMLGQKVH